MPRVEIATHVPISQAKKAILYCIGEITPKRVPSGGTQRLRGLAPGQYRSEETSQRWRAVGDTVFDFTGPVVEPQISRTDSDVFLHHFCNGNRVKKVLVSS